MLTVLYGSGRYTQYTLATFIVNCSLSAKPETCPDPEESCGPRLQPSVPLTADVSSSAWRRASGLSPEHAQLRSDPKMFLGW